MKRDILKVIPENYVSAAQIMTLLPLTYKNHIPSIQSLGAYLSQMARDEQIESALVYYKNGNASAVHVYRKKAIE